MTNKPKIYKIPMPRMKAKKALRAQEFMDLVNKLSPVTSILCKIMLFFRPWKEIVRPDGQVFRYKELAGVPYQLQETDVMLYCGDDSQQIGSKVNRISEKF